MGYNLTNYVLKPATGFLSPRLFVQNKILNRLIAFKFSHILLNFKILTSTFKNLWKIRQKSDQPVFRSWLILKLVRTLLTGILFEVHYFLNRFALYKNFQNHLNISVLQLDSSITDQKFSVILTESPLYRVEFFFSLFFNSWW